MNAFRSKPENATLDPDAFAPLDDEWEYTAIPVLDSSETLSDRVTPICAQHTYADAQKALARLGLEMLTPDDVDLLHELAERGEAIELPAFTGTPIAETSLVARRISDEANRAAMRRAGRKPGQRVCNFGKGHVKGAPPGRMHEQGWWVSDLARYTPPPGEPGHRSGPGFIQPRPAPGSRGAHGADDQADDGTNTWGKRRRWRALVDDITEAAADAATKEEAMPNFIPDRITHVTLDEMKDALTAAWRALLGEEPSERSILVLLAHWSLETGSGRSMHCYNVGNIKGSGRDGRSWTMFRCSEILNGREVWFDPPHPQTHFRAYETLDAGVADYLELVHRRFAASWPAVLSGDPAAFAHALKAQRYYTANEAAYTKTLVDLFEGLVERFSGFDLSSRENISSALTKLGYVGDYDSTVRAFQKASGLVVDGKVGPKTRAALIAALQGAA